jgi:2-polyprenyl-3-methyl-5-hydroxy-6-metoxy-1,4-benzoquinol methylase
MQDISRYDSIATLFSVLLKRWPEHSTYLERSFEERSDSVMQVSDHLAKTVISLSETIDGGLAALCDDYRYLCEKILLPEELHFRRNGSYRLSSFADADRECYSNAPLMNRYMNGLLISNVMWNNHAQAFSAFVNSYLPELHGDARHLEVGPGHGFFLFFAAENSNITSLTGWDVSPTSVENTRHALSVLGVKQAVDLKVQDLFAAGEPDANARFDSIVISEVLEHVEDPYAALRAVSKWLRPGGKIWINVPANSPAPDHIYLFRNLEHAVDMVEECKLEVINVAAFPISGVTLENAIKRKQTVTCIITATKSL